MPPTAKKTAAKKTAAKKTTTPSKPTPESVDLPEGKKAFSDTPSGGFPNGFEGYPEVVDGVRPVTQNPGFDPTFDNEEDFA